MLALILAAFFVPSTWAAVRPLNLSPDQLSFDYRSADGEFQLDCKHYVLSEELHDFRVLCGPGTIHERSYVAHVLVRSHQREQRPQMAFEILYWVTDRQAPHGRQFSSTTQLIEFSDKAQLHKIQMSQSLENDYAGLWMEFRP